MNRFHCILGDLLASPKVSLYFYQQDGRKFTRGRTEPILGLKQRLRQSLLPCNRSCLAHRTRSKLTWPCLSVIQTNAAEIVYYTSPEAADVTNAIFLLGSFLVAHLGATPEQAWSPFAHLSGAVRPYRDATWCRSPYDLHVKDCFKGLAKALHTNLYCPASFDEEEYFYYDHPSNGDMHEVVKGKFFAFKGPTGKTSQKSAFLYDCPECRSGQTDV
jgi:hypothetical protein